MSLTDRVLIFYCRGDTFFLLQFACLDSLPFHFVHLVCHAGPDRQRVSRARRARRRARGRLPHGHQDRLRPALLLLRGAVPQAAAAVRGRAAGRGHLRGLLAVRRQGLIA